MMPARFQSALDAAGIQAARIEMLWWLMFWVTTGVFVLVAGAVILAVWRGRSEAAARPSERSLLIGVSAATMLTVVVLFGLLYASAATGRAIGTAPGPGALTVRITGYQWWWAIEYPHDQPSLQVTTANELHIPVGRPVVLHLHAADVIHSFWVPNLHGKMDLVPGRRNTTWLQADSPGTYRGQCAEYCGLQHANMGLTVVAEAPADFERWLAAQRAGAALPASPDAQRGRAIVERGPCALCHTVRGTQAAARLGPDLTHVGSRATIAAATLPNTREYLARWIEDPQHFKPGNRMPSSGLSPGDLQAVAAYLEGLR
jgi:cytochrome c oxidase subunit 2